MLTANIIFAAVLVCGLSLAEVCERGTYEFNNKCYEPNFQRGATFETANLVCNEKNWKLAVSDNGTREFLHRIALITKYAKFWVGHFNDCYAISHENEFITEKEDCRQNFFYICEFDCQWRSTTPWKLCFKLSENREKYKDAKESCSKRGGKLAEIYSDEKRHFVEDMIYDIDWLVGVDFSKLKNSNAQIFWAGTSYGKNSKRWEDWQGTIVNFHDNLTSNVRIPKNSCTINTNGDIGISDCDVNNFFFCEYEMYSFPNDIDTASSNQDELQTLESTTVTVSATTNSNLYPTPTQLDLQESSMEVEVQKTDRYQETSVEKMIIFDVDNGNEKSQFETSTDNYRKYDDTSEVENHLSDKPETLKSERDKPETLKSERDKPETLRSEMDKPETLKSEKDKPEIDKPETFKSERDKPEIDKPETIKPEIDKPETLKSEMDKPETFKSESDNSDKLKPQEYVIIGILAGLSILITVVIVQLMKLRKRNALAMGNKVTRDEEASVGNPTEQTNLPLINGRPLNTQRSDADIDENYLVPTGYDYGYSRIPQYQYIESIHSSQDTVYTDASHRYESIN